MQHAELVNAEVIPPGATYGCGHLAGYWIFTFVVGAAVGSGVGGVGCDVGTGVGAAVGAEVGRNNEAEASTWERLVVSMSSVVDDNISRSFPRS